MELMQQELKACMESLLAGAVVYDDIVENELKKYADLRSHADLHAKNINTIKNKQKSFEKVFKKFADYSVYRKESIHLTKLNQEYNKEKAEFEKYNSLIAKNQLYYDTMSATDVDKLWGFQHHVSMLIAIYYMFGDSLNDISLKIQKYYGQKEIVNTRIMLYMLQKALVLSDKYRCSNDERAKIDEIAWQIANNMNEKLTFSNPFGDETEKAEGEQYLEAQWTAVKKIILVRMAQRNIEAAKKLVKEYSDMENAFDSFEKGYANISEEQKKKIKDLKQIKLDDAAKEAVKNFEKWYAPEDNSINSLIKERREGSSEIKTNSAKIEKEIELLNDEKFYDENFGAGKFTKEVEQKIYEQLNEQKKFIENAAASRKKMTTVYNFERKRIAFVKEFQTRYAVAKNEYDRCLRKVAEVRSEKEHRKNTKKEQKREKRARFWRNIWNHKLVVLICLLLFIWYLPTILELAAELLSGVSMEFSEWLMHIADSIQDFNVEVKEAVREFFTKLLTWVLEILLKILKAVFN